MTAPQEPLAVREVLPSGVTVLAQQTTTTPAVTLEASLRAGTIGDPPGLEGLSHFVSRTLDRGTATRSSDEIAEIFDSRGVSLTVSVNRHLLSLACTCLVEDFETTLGVLIDIVRQPSFPAAEVERRRSEIITLIRQDEDSPAAVATEVLAEMLYGTGHPYGRRQKGTLQSVAKIDRAALHLFHRQQCGPAGLSLAVVGDVEVAQAVDAAQAACAGWAGVPAPAVPFAPAQPPAATRRTRVVPMMDKSQADIAYGFTTITRADPAYYAYWLMNTILGQYALGGRLGDRIREQQGMAYYVHSSFDPGPLPGPLTIRAGVSPANVERAVASIDAELRRFVDSGPTDREMAETTQYLIGSMPRALETNLGIAGYLQMTEFFGLGLDYARRVPDLVRAVTRDDVHEAARRTMQPDRAAVVVAGPYPGTLQ